MIVAPATSNVPAVAGNLGTAVCYCSPPVMCITCARFLRIYREVHLRRLVFTKEAHRA